MKLSNAAPFLFAATIALAGVAAFAPAQAAEHRLSDAAYIAEARCVGLTEGLKVSNTVLTNDFDRQSGGRVPLAHVIAEQNRADGQRQAELSPYWRQIAIKDAAQSCSTFGSKVSAVARADR